MDAEIAPRLPGRQAEAARNDQRILDAARAVFTADPNAPISAVAERAGVGISALYRRYAGKEDLLRRLCGDDQRSNRLRHRYLTLYLDALRHPSPTPLPGPPPTWAELGERWNP